MIVQSTDRCIPCDTCHKHYVPEKTSIVCNDCMILFPTKAREGGFNEAIEKVLFYLTEESESYAVHYKNCTPKQKTMFKYKALALADFKLYLEQLFKQIVF